MVKKGDVVYIRPEWQDPGDNDFTWIAMSDEEKGRVDIAAFPCELNILPTQTVRIEWLESL